MIGLLPICLLLSFGYALDIPPYVKQCKKAESQLNKCVIEALHHLKPYLAKGIPEIEMPTVEPFKMDALSLSLTTGPNGYKVTLRDIDVYGASNFTIKNLRLATNGQPFEAIISIPQMNIQSKYSSSGVLLILPASGNGTFHGTFKDLTAKVHGKVSSTKRDGLDYMNLDDLNVDLNIKGARLMVRKDTNSNRILIEATNLFLRDNSLEVVKLMMPQLNEKLTVVFKRISNQLLKYIPQQMYLI